MTTVPEDLTEWRKETNESIAVHPTQVLALIDEVARLRKAFQALDAHRLKTQARDTTVWVERLKFVEQQRDDAIEVLRDVEWSWKTQGRDRVPYCLQCGNRKQDGHLEDCALAALLKESS